MMPNKVEIQTGKYKEFVKCTSESLINSIDHILIMFTGIKPFISLNENKADEENQS